MDNVYSFLERASEHLAEGEARTNQRIRAAVVDPRALTREAYSCFLRMSSPDFDVLQASAATELTSPASQDIHLAVLTVGACRLSTPWVRKALSIFSSSLTHIPLAVLCDSDDFSEVCEAIYCGARGYILTTYEPLVAVEIMRFVRAGGVYVPAHILQYFARQKGLDNSPDAIIANLYRLSPRQQDVLRLMCDGKTNKAIAYALDLAEGTVKVHIGVIMRKLGVRNRTEASLLAYRLRFFER
jgi:DNA-binding NarL/FixJ family response regulator